MSAIYFESVGPDNMPDMLSMHEGCDVESGEKWVATKVRSRPPRSGLPTRLPSLLAPRADIAALARAAPSLG